MADYDEYDLVEHEDAYELTGEEANMINSDPAVYPDWLIELKNNDLLGDVVISVEGEDEPNEELTEKVRAWARAGGRRRRSRRRTRKAKKSRKSRRGGKKTKAHRRR